MRAKNGCARRFDTISGNEGRRYSPVSARRGGSSNGGVCGMLYESATLMTQARDMAALANIRRGAISAFFASVVAGFAYIPRRFSAYPSGIAAGDFLGVACAFHEGFTGAGAADDGTISRQRYLTARYRGGRWVGACGGAERCSQTRETANAAKW
jgi:hypothetical protein